MKLELEDEIEGDHIGTTDFFFKKIGEPVPITPRPQDSQFDLKSPPSQPLALSERFQLIFVAHSSGFCVARTKDVMDLAKGSGSSSIQELSVVDVPIGKVHILALSTDNSMLAASVGGGIHFFSVNSLLNKEAKPSFSCFLNESSFVKDIHWINKPENSYILLSNHGKLYHGAVDDPLKDVMDNVDAVEWSGRGNLIVVAKGNSLSILSSKFKERLSMSLSFKSWIGDSDVDCIVKVDSIRWIRLDCIIVGCFQLSADGKEENYLVQLIRSKDGKFTDASSKPVVLSFYDVFQGFIDDIVPPGSGPHLFLSYLEQCGLAIIANRKNTDQHIVLIGWPGDEQSEAAVIDIDRDNWLPRIELQENGDYNLVMGLCIDKVSHFDKVKIQLGFEEQRELSPYCLLLCLTLEGKLTMFHVASVTETTVPPEVVCALSDEEEDTPAVERVECDLSKLSSGWGKQSSEQVALGIQPQDTNKEELNTKGGTKIPMKKDVKPSDVNEYTIAKHISHEETITENSEVKSRANVRSLEAEGQQKLPVSKLYQETDGQQIQHSGQQITNLEKPSLKTNILEGPSYLARDVSKTESQKVVGIGPSDVSFIGKYPSNTHGQSNSKHLQRSVEAGKESQGNFGSPGLHNTSTQPWSDGNIIFAKGTDARSSPSPLSFVDGNKSENAGLSGGAANLPGVFVGKPSNLKDTAKLSTSARSSVRPAESMVQSASAVMRNIESLPSIRSSQLSLQESFALEKSPSNKFHLSKENYRNPPQSGMLNSEPNLSKQFSNVKEMVKELDSLLECIEESGGFRDACTVLLKSSVEALEQGIGTISERSRMWRRMLNAQLGEIQLLLDKTVQDVARKIYMEGIIKQASDSRYWDLWNRQKLSSELELKQQHILKLNQDLTNQLIEMERHFNTIELNKFGENDGVHRSRRGLQKVGPSRHIQSLHSLNNTTSSQLAAAEQLSKCLSKQMTMLSIEPPSVKQQNVKKELFETIGIPYDASFSSPDVTKVSDSPSSKKLLHSSGSAATKARSRRNQSSSMKSYESETARRRRDSLDMSWASFEPPKTTVKRMLLQESQKVSSHKSSLSLNAQQTGPQMLEGSAVVHGKNLTTPPAFFNPSGDKGIHGTPSSTPFRLANDLPGPSQTTGLKSPILQRNNLSASYSLPASHLSPIAGKNCRGETGNTTAERSSSGVTYSKKYHSFETKSVLKSEASSHLTSSISIGLPTLPLPKTYSEISNSSSTEAVFTNSAIGSVKDQPINTESSFSGSGKSHDSPFIPTSTVPTTSSLPEKAPHLDATTSRSQPGKNVSPFPAFLTSVSAPSSPMIDSSTTVSLSRFMTSSKATIDANQMVSSISTTSPSPSPIVFSSSTLSFQASETLGPSSTLSASIIATSESPKTEVSTLVGKSTPKTDNTSTTDAPPLQSQPRFGEFSLKLEPSVSSAPIAEISTGLASGSQASFNRISSSKSSVALNTQPEQPSAVRVLFPSSVSNSGSPTSGKNESLDIEVTQEDDMEEETPEKGHATELSLGSFGGFGIGSTPNPTAARPNPFGGPFSSGTTNPASTPFTATVPSGELFRPASFSFQSPQPSQPLQLTNISAFSSGFGNGTTSQAPAQIGFGQPSQIGPGQPSQIGPGQQALGSVLGAFGQSRQFGAGLPGSGFASASGFGGGFTGTNSIGGFSSAAAGGGFAGVASSGGGFAGLASGGGGFAGITSGGMGYAGGGFAGTALAAGDGFGGAFNNQQGSGGFSTFSGSPGGTGKPSELFTQIRK